LIDGRGDPIADGLIETWQIAPAPFRGFGRCATDRDGWYRILTMKPAALSEGAARYAPHVVMFIFARGLLKHAVTRVYFSDEPIANAADPVLSGIRDEAARASLIAHAAPGGYRFDVRMQGEGETLFFDV
jgi:protocatechuate 3,4-dioxygenase alpha subunit